MSAESLRIGGHRPPLQHESKSVHPLALNPSYTESRFFKKSADLGRIVPLQLDLSPPHSASAPARLTGFSSELCNFYL
jgi:hypothetical protein